MSATAFALFDTALGPCAIAWGPGGIAGLQLPEASDRQTRQRMQRRFAAAREASPSLEAQQAIDAVVALLRGEAVDLSAVALDLADTAPFDCSVYAVARTIAPGTTLSYGEVAERLGDARLARAVGQALGRNPFAIIVPCHRVLTSDGRLGGFSAAGGAATKRRLLQIENARPGEAPELFDLPTSSA